MNFRDFCRSEFALGWSTSWAVLVLWADKFHAISDTNCNGGVCDCCMNFDVALCEVIRVVDLATMEILWEQKENS